MPEGTVHLRVRTFLWQLLLFALGPEHTVGSDQFVYWNAAEPKRCVSPDVFVRLGAPQTNFDSWKCWERGTPQLAVEIISPHEDDGIGWDTKIGRYHEIGVAELVRFDPLEAPGARLRAWDRVDGDFVERVVEGDRMPCLTLGLTWVVEPLDADVVALRLADAEGRLVESKEEALVRERATEARGREAETRVREAAEARVRELEEKVKRLGG